MRHAERTELSVTDYWSVTDEEKLTDHVRRYIWFEYSRLLFVHLLENDCYPSRLRARSENWILFSLRSSHARIASKFAGCCALQLRHLALPFRSQFSTKMVRNFYLSYFIFMIVYSLWPLKPKKSSGLKARSWCSFDVAEYGHSRIDGLDCWRYC